MPELASFARCYFRLLPSVLGVALKEPVKEAFRKLGVIIDLLIELEVPVDHPLEQVIDHVIEGQASILPRIGPQAGFQGRVARQSHL